MTWRKALRFLLSGFRYRIVVVRPAAMTEEELDKALGNISETHPVYRAFMQVIDQAEDEAHDCADKDIYMPRALEAHTGGAKYLRAVRENVLLRRHRFAKRRGTSNPVEKTGQAVQ